MSIKLELSREEALITLTEHQGGACKMRGHLRIYSILNCPRFFESCKDYKRN